jgi:putative nucleotidyltransferase with HDIG domain
MLRDELDQQAKRWRDLSSVLASLSTHAANQDKLYEVISHIAREQLKGDYAAIFLRSGGDLTIRGVEGLSRETAEKLRIPASQSFVSYMQQKSTPVILSTKSMDREIGLFTKMKESVASVLCAPITMQGGTGGFIWIGAASPERQFSEQDKNFVNLLAMFFSMTINHALLTEKGKIVFRDTLITLAEALEARDAYTKMHSYNVADYSVTFAKAIRLPARDVEILKMSARLHDIGKIGVRDDILNKPGKLTDEEFEYIKSHPTIGARILEPLDFLKDQIPFVKYHHEKWDGTGYPEGLKGDQIPLGAQILSLADVFDALTTDRPYRKGFSVEKTFEIMRDMSGKNFEPGMLTKFFKVIETDVMGKRG